MRLPIPGIAEIRSKFSVPEKCLCRPKVIVTGFLIALSLYWVFETVSAIWALRTPMEKVSLSALGVGIENLNKKPQTAEFPHIAGYGIWDLQLPDAKAVRGTAAGKEVVSGSFAQKEFNKVPAVYSLVDENYRWEFYGVVGNGRKRAVFFNPAGTGGENSGWRQFVLGEPMDGNLVLKEIGKDRVVIFFNKERKNFVLELFRVNQP